MKLEPPLANLMKSCETFCEAACCGIDAYDFSPINIAYHLRIRSARVDRDEKGKILQRLARMKARHGTGGADEGVTIEEMNQKFTANQVDEFVNEITANIESALDLIAQGEARRYRNPDRGN